MCIRDSLPCARLAVDQHPPIGRRHQLDLLAQRLHLAIQVRPLQPQRLGSAAHIAVALVQLLQDVVPLIRLARLQQRGELLATRPGLRAIARSLAKHQHGQVLAFDPLRLRIQDQHPLHQIAQLAHIPRPVVLPQCLQGILRHLHMRPPILLAELLQKLLHQ